MSSTPPPISVLFIASEALPFAKTGGLADVAGALPAALARLGLRVTVVVPRYRGVEAPASTGVFDVPMGGEPPIRMGWVAIDAAAGHEVVLLECPELYDRPGIYGTPAGDFPDNARRFAALTRGALEWASRRGREVEVVHAHDWQAGLAAVYLKAHYRDDPVLGGAATVLTIHNLAFQGVFTADHLQALDLPGWAFTPEGVEYFGQISFLKAGIVFSEVVTTVSPAYAAEIRTPALGFGLDGALRTRGERLVGILNGIDTAVWDPSSDPMLPASYSAADLSGKASCRRALLERFGLPDVPGRPVIGMISRLVDQKGFDLVAETAGRLVELDGVFTILGSGEARYETLLGNLAERHPDKVGVTIGFDEPLAHLIEGGADVFLMPSRFEPCGLNQMYSLRYGTLPVVHATGGLADTVEDHASEASPGTGFKFRTYSGEAMLEALGRALGVFARPDVWRRMQRAGMGRDFSWDSSAAAYKSVYARARNLVPGETSG